MAQGRGPLGPSRALRDAVVPRPGVTLQPSEAGGDSSSKREGSEAGGGGFGAGMLAGLRAAAPLLPSLPPSCRSRVLAAVIPCSGLKISPGAAAAHRHLEVVINNPGGAAHAGPASLRPFPAAAGGGRSPRPRHAAGGVDGQREACGEMGTEQHLPLGHVGKLRHRWGFAGGRGG